MKDYYWRSWYFARKRFTKEDQLLAMYLYDTKDHLISSYRYNSVTYPKDIYKAEYDDNSERVYDYVHGKRTDLMISGYHKFCRKERYCAICAETAIIMMQTGMPWGIWSVILTVRHLLLSWLNM